MYLGGVEQRRSSGVGVKRLRRRQRHDADEEREHGSPSLSPCRRVTGRESLPRAPTNDQQPGAAMKRQLEAARTSPFP